MPKWTDDEQKFAKDLQKSMIQKEVGLSAKVLPLEPRRQRQPPSSCALPCDPARRQRAACAESTRAFASLPAARPFPSRSQSPACRSPRSPKHFLSIRDCFYIKNPSCACQPAPPLAHGWKFVWVDRFAGFAPAAINRTLCLARRSTKESVLPSHLVRRNAKHRSSPADGRRWQ